MTIRKIRKHRLPDVVAEQLAAAVRGGEFAAGERLPPERELAARFGVSRNVVREAVNELRSRGLLETRQGSGSVVSDRVHKPVSDLFGTMVQGQTCGEDQLLELRAALESNVVRLAAERSGEQEIADMQRLLDAYDRAGGDTDACAELDLAFHRALVDATHNDLFRVVLASVDELMVRSRKAALRRSGVEVAAASHAKILAAVRRRRPAAAARAMEEHLAITRAHLKEAREKQAGRD